MAETIEQFVDSIMPTGDFAPFAFHSEEADAITAHFEDVQDYSKRLNTHVTLFLAADDNRIVGCRIKNVAAIIEDLPNFIEANHNDCKLTVLFALVRSPNDGKYEREAVNKLGRMAKETGLKLQPCE